MNINGATFDFVDVYPRTVTIPDCFVFEPNKIGRGHGEAKLYIGSNDEVESFFGGEGFVVSCFLLKSDLLGYMEAIKQEHRHPSQNYFRKDDFEDLWEERVELIKALPDAIEFKITHQRHIKGPRGYINSKSEPYKLLRQISLPNITVLYIEKYIAENGCPIYYWKLYADYSLLDSLNGRERALGQSDSQSNGDKIDCICPVNSEDLLFRSELLKQTAICPITRISDPKLLRATRIIPLSVLNEEDEINPYNGYMLSPFVSLLFENGYITFTNDRKVVLSNAISVEQWKNIGIKEKFVYDDILIDEKRIKYLDFHHKNIFKGIYTE